MNEYDPKIEKALDEYARETKPDADKVLGPSRALLAEKRRQKGQKQSGLGLFFGKAALGGLACCLVLVLVLVPMLRLLVGNRADGGAEGPEALPRTYTAADLRAYKTSEAELGQKGISVLPLPENAFSVELKLFCLRQSNDPVLLQYTLRVPAPVGYDEVTVFAELTQTNRYENNQVFYQLQILGGDYAYASGSHAYIDGEYLSLGFVARGYEYCLRVMNPAEYRLYHYLDIFFGK